MRRALLTLTVLLLGSGCYTYRAAPAPLPTTRVRVRFDPPHIVDVAAPGGGTMRLADVTALEGDVIQVRGDTVSLVVRNVHARGGRLPALAPGSTAVVPIGVGRVIETRRVDATRTALGVAAAVGLGLVALLISAIIAVGSTY
jgi:hypothetical protein